MSRLHPLSVIAKTKQLVLRPTQQPKLAMSVIWLPNVVAPSHSEDCVSSDTVEGLGVYEMHISERDDNRMGEC
jgi:hypothetical protein